MSNLNVPSSQSQASAANRLGTLTGVGIGPGDPELITLKGLRAIQRVPVVAFPAGTGSKPGIAEQIAADWVSPAQIRLPLTFPYVLEADVLKTAWKAAADQVWAHLVLGQDVAFLCEGDVSFYGSFTYLAQTVQQQHPEISINVIPGVGSPMAAAAALGIPLTTQGQRLLVLPALYAVADLETALEAADVVVLMKVKSVYRQAWQILARRGLLNQSAVVEWATWPQQTIYQPLSDRPNLDLSYFSLLIVQTAGLHTSARQHQHQHTDHGMGN